MTNVSSPGRVSRLQALKNVWDDSLHRTTQRNSDSPLQTNMKKDYDPRVTRCLDDEKRRGMFNFKRTIGRLRSHFDTGSRGECTDNQ